jgi:hypothetical protein
VNNSRIVVRLLENSTFYSQKRENKMCSPYFHSKFYPKFSTSRYPGEKYVFTRNSIYFQTSKTALVAVFCILKITHTELRVQCPYTLPTNLSLPHSVTSNAVHNRLCALRSIYEHFHTEHQHICTSPKFIRTDNISQCVHKSTLKTHEN